MEDFFGSRADYHAHRSGKSISREGCPFCEEFLDTRAVIWEGKYWRLLYNKYPYTGNAEHIMATPREHIIFSADITEEMWQEWREVQQMVRAFYGEKSYFSFTRESFAEGDDRSVEHWHMHFVPGKLQGKFLRKMLELQGFPITQALNFE